MQNKFGKFRKNQKFVEKLTNSDKSWTKFTFFLLTLANGKPPSPLVSKPLAFCRPPPPLAC